MRIIGGSHRGQALRLPRSGATRPTADRVRESLFNVLAHGIDWDGFAGASVVDAFAGTGACGLEALSRGASHATFIDVDKAALTAIKRNAAALGEARNIALLKLDATRLPTPADVVHAPCAFAFLDPPYQSGMVVAALQGLATRHWLAPGAVVVAEVAVQEPLAPPPGYTTLQERMYGAARLVFLRLER